ncbi:hypothetical protein ACUODJ_41755, partial [Escherichia sp. HC-CC]
MSLISLFSVNCQERRAVIAASVGEVLPDGMVNIIGVGSCPS